MYHTRFLHVLGSNQQIWGWKITQHAQINASSFDDISLKILKHCSSGISSPLACIINLCLKAGNFPDQLKIGKVIPVFNSSDIKNIKYYHRISILPAFSKVLDKIILNRLINYLESNRLLTDHQRGFRANHSTESAILQLVSNIYGGLEGKFFVLGIFLD